MIRERRVARLRTRGRTLVIPVHGATVKEHIIRQVLEATREESEEQEGN